MNYSDAYNYINSFTNYEKVPGITYALEMDSLTRVDLLMRLLGNPQSRFRSIVIAGTKGKGSVAAMTEAILRAGGVKTGLYTSPHLHTFRERMRVAGQMIPAADMGRITETVKAVVDKIKELDEPGLLPTTYELATAIAFLYFAEQEVEVAVLEVGLGGRLDAVNIATPMVSVITSISLDHTQVLGDTVGRIAEEKAGIIKRGGRAIVAPQSMEAAESIRRIAAAQRASVQVVTEDVYVSTHHLPEVISDDEGVPIYQVFTLAYSSVQGDDDKRIRVKLPLLGSHQQLNAAVALATVRALKEDGIHISTEAIARGFAEVSWPGRLEVIHRDPVIVVDGAHNVDSMAKLNQSMYDLFYGHKLIVVIGLSKDKDRAGIFRELGAGQGNVIGPAVEKVIVTRAEHARAAYPDDLAQVARECGLYVEVREDLDEALATAEGIARAGSQGNGHDPVVLVTGSLFIVAEAREHYGLAPDLRDERAG